MRLTDANLQIKTLKSLQDGSLIRLEELAGEKKLVMLKINPIKKTQTHIHKIGY